jgi:hypothetical protein
MMPSTASAPQTTMTHRSHGSQVADRPSSTNAHPAVTPTAKATTERPTQPSVRSHSAIAPMPTRAAMGGASATM